MSDANVLVRTNLAYDVLHNPHVMHSHPYLLGPNYYANPTASDRADVVLALAIAFEADVWFYADVTAELSCLNVDVSGD